MVGCGVGSGINEGSRFLWVTSQGITMFEFGKNESEIECGLVICQNDPETD